MTLTELLLGERLEIRSSRQADDVLAEIRDSIDPLRWGLWDAPGDLDFVGKVDPPRFQVRQHRRFWVLRRRYCPTARGTVVPDGGESILRATFRMDFWLRLSLLFFLVVVASSAREVRVTLFEVAFIAVIVALNVWSLEAEKSAVRAFLSSCCERPAKPMAWRYRLEA